MQNLDLILKKQGFMNKKEGKILHISEILEIYYPQFKRYGGKNENLGGLRGKNNLRKGRNLFGEN